MKGLVFTFWVWFFLFFFYNLGLNSDVTGWCFRENQRQLQKLVWGGAINKVSLVQLSTTWRRSTTSLTGFLNSSLSVTQQSNLSMWFNLTFYSTLLNIIIHIIKLIQPDGRSKLIRCELSFVFAINTLCYRISSLNTQLCNFKHSWTRTEKQT